MDQSLLLPSHTHSIPHAGMAASSHSIVVDIRHASAACQTEDQLRMWYACLYRIVDLSTRQKMPVEDHHKDEPRSPGCFPLLYLPTYGADERGGELPYWLYTSIQPRTGTPNSPPSPNFLPLHSLVHASVPTTLGNIATNKSRSYFQRHAFPLQVKLFRCMTGIIQPWAPPLDSGTWKLR